MNVSVALLQRVLAEFANSIDFSEQMTQIFGEGHDYTALQRSWLDGNITAPTIEIISSSQINGANGAYSPTTEKIYLSQELVNSGDIQSITLVDY